MSMCVHVCYCVRKPRADTGSPPQLLSTLFTEADRRLSQLNLEHGRTAGLAHQLSLGSLSLSPSTEITGRLPCLRALTQCAGCSYVKLTQAGVIRKEGDSGEKMSPYDPDVRHFLN